VCPPKQYADAARTGRIRDQLAGGERVTRAIFAAGFHSNSRFYATSASILGMKPTVFRAGDSKVPIRFAVGRPRAVRAVAAACAANRIAVAIPCHRIVRSDGSPAGYP